MFIVTVGILIIHMHLGWFVGEHGTGGVEHSLALLVSLITTAAADRSDHRATK
jgi:putative oxidoreductase